MGYMGSETIHVALRLAKGQEANKVGGHNILSAIFKYLHLFQGLHFVLKDGKGK